MSETAATPKPAATILLLRPGKNSLEVFMVVRHHQIDFASGALVFPGGKADPQDFEDSLMPHLQAQQPTQTCVQLRSAQFGRPSKNAEFCWPEKWAVTTSLAPSDCRVCKNKESP